MRAACEDDFDEVAMHFEDLIGLGPFAMNCFIASGENPKTCVIFDPGDDAAKIIESVRQLQPEEVCIYLTHAHLDHVLAIADVNTAFQAPLYVPEGDVELYDNLAEQCRLFGLPIVEPLKTYQTFAPNTRRQLAGSDVAVLSVPGHTPGGVAFHFEKEQVLVSGDLLFRGSIGRTDLWGGDLEAMQRSLQQVMQLPDETIVRPGHGPMTTIADERQNNPFIREWVQASG